MHGVRSRTKQPDIDAIMEQMEDEICEFVGPEAMADVLPERIGSAVAAHGIAVSIVTNALMKLLTSVPDDIGRARVAMVIQMFTTAPTLTDDNSKEGDVVGFDVVGGRPQ